MSYDHAAEQNRWSELPTRLAVCGRLGFHTGLVSFVSLSPVGSRSPRTLGDMRRAEILRELARFETPTEPLLQELRSFGWDWSDAPLLVLTKADFLRVIDRFLAGYISAAQLQEWAENLEVREDVAFDERDAELLDDVFFRIATPEINEPLIHDVVQRMRDEITRVA